MTGRYPSASTALPTSLAMVFTASKSSLEVAGKPASIMSTPSLASCRAIGDVIRAAAEGRCGCGCGVGVEFDGGETGSGRRRYRVGVRESEVK